MKTRWLVSVASDESVAREYLAHREGEVVIASHPARAAELGVHLCARPHLGETETYVAAVTSFKEGGDVRVYRVSAVLDLDVCLDEELSSRRVA